MAAALLTERAHSSLVSRSSSSSFSDSVSPECCRCPAPSIVVGCTCTLIALSEWLPLFHKLDLFSVCNGRTRMDLAAVAHNKLRNSK
jgi:hypothetical protein